MTKRQRLEAVINGNITEELIEECKAELAKLDAQGAKALAKSKETELHKENEELTEKIYLYLGSEPKTAEEIAEEFEVKRPRVTALCTKLVKEGRLVVEDLKIKGKGIRKAYHR